jgi:hypothetical protein
MTKLLKGARALGQTAKLAEAGISAGSRARAGQQRWQCHACGLVLTSWARCEAHTSEHGIGCRFDCVIEGS